MGEATLSIDLPLNDRKSEERLEIVDLVGLRVYVLDRAGEAFEQLAQEMEALGTVDVVRVQDYTLDLFNQCAEEGSGIVTSGAWSGLHPMLTTVELMPRRANPCALLYALEPRESVVKMVNALRACGVGGCPL